MSDVKRTTLAHVTRMPEGDLHVAEHETGGEVQLEDYSRFKYVDGSVAADYGISMAKQVMKEFPDLLNLSEVFVTSSAFKVAPPSSRSLLIPFVETAQVIAETSGSETSFRRFKINRTDLTEHDYATLSIAEREVIMRQNGLKLDEVSVANKTVIALDDIFVTGSHEQNIADLMTDSGASEVIYPYILHVTNGREYPSTESDVNSEAMKNISDLVVLANQKDFVPNARIAKYLLARNTEEMVYFVANVSGKVLTTVFQYMRGDELHKMESYTKAFRKFSLLHARRLVELTLEDDEIDKSSF
jgi:hypothetical protein